MSVNQISHTIKFVHSDFLHSFLSFLNLNCAWKWDLWHKHIIYLHTTLESVVGAGLHVMRQQSTVTYVCKRQKHSYEEQKWDRYKTYKLFKVHTIAAVPTKDKNCWGIACTCSYDQTDEPREKKLWDREPENISATGNRPCQNQTLKISGITRPFTDNEGAVL